MTLRIALALVLVALGSLLPPGPAWAQAAAAAAAAPAADSAAGTRLPRFDVLEYVVEGNSVLAVEDIELALMPHMGPGLTLDDVERGRAALEAAYQRRGFLSVAVDIPEQRVADGLVRLSVVEGRVEKLRVTGARWFDQGVIRAAVPELTPGRVPNFEQLQAQLAQASIEARQLQPVLRPGTRPGTLEAELQVQDRLPGGASIELNNQHAADTDPWRLQAALSYDNLWQREHAIALTLITAPREPEQSGIALLNYAVPLSDGWSWSASAVWSDSLVEPVGASVIGRGFSAGLRLQRRFLVGAASHTMGAGFDYKHLRERLQFGDDSLSTPLRYLPLQASWQAGWWDSRSSTTLESQWTLALRSVLQRDVDCPGSIGPVDQFACKREGGDGGFHHLRADLRHQRAAPWGLPGRVAARLYGQLASQPLVSAEQFAVGGAGTVRGYLEAEASGDRGLLASVEWSGPNLLDAGADDRWQLLQVSAFVDAARIWILSPAFGQTPRVSLHGAGVGLRVQARPGLSAEADLAWPGQRTASTPDHDPRLHLRVRAQF